MQGYIYVQYGRLICSEAYAKSQECMYTFASGHIIHCSDFIWGICMDIVVISAPKAIDIYHIYDVLRGIFVAGTYMDVVWIQVAVCWFFDLYLR